jgi:hypothetical protein
MSDIGDALDRMVEVFEDFVDRDTALLILSELAKPQATDRLKRWLYMSGHILPSGWLHLYSPSANPRSGGVSRRGSFEYLANEPDRIGAWAVPGGTESNEAVWRFR